MKRLVKPLLAVMVLMLIIGLVVLAFIIPAEFKDEDSFSPFGEWGKNKYGGDL